MSVTPEKKKEIIEKFKLHEKDTGSCEVQVAIMTERIKNLTEHLKVHKHDYATRLGLFKLIGRRRRLLNYLAKKDIERYRKLIKALGLRR